MYFVTDNPHKYREAQEVLSSYGVDLRMLKGAKVELQGDDLGFIAMAAARIAYMRFRVPVVVEDAGLFIEALSGFPGPYSSYVYKRIGVNGIINLLKGVRRREAHFLAVVACVCPPFEARFEAKVRGVIADEPRGSGGFGFDPIFIPEGESRTFGEMNVSEKNKWSHRSKAFAKLGAWLQKVLRAKAQMQFGGPESSG